MATRTQREKADMALPTLIDLFIQSEQIEGRSQKTLKWYRANLNSFSEFMTNGRPATLRELTLDDARSFVAHLQSRTKLYEGNSLRPAVQAGLSSHNIHGYVPTLKGC